MNTKSKNGSRKSFWILAVLVLGAAIWYFGVVGKLTGSATASSEEREVLYKETIARVSASSAAWPKTEKELISAFWNAIASNSLEQATLYCPGSTQSDYGSYTRLKPTSQLLFGQPHPHPRAKGVTLWPVQVKFTYYGAKTLKFAITTIAPGQFIIDGQKSIWW